MTVPRDGAEELRARFVELAPAGFEEVEAADAIELAAYGEAAERVAAEFADARVTEVEAGWEERWREFHRPITIGPLWIGPPWETPASNALAVVIDPGRAFGTGAHATTRLCLELLLDCSRGSLLDIGCGSGVLAIAAARLGFAPVVALDFDAAATDATAANALVNDVEIDVRHLDALTDELPTAEVGVANIALAAVQALVPRLKVERVITSGYLASDRPALNGWQHLDRRELDGWAADLHVRA